MGGHDANEQEHANEHARAGKTALLAVGALAVLGILTRLALLLRGASFHIDESKLALNLVSRSFWELFLPLDYEQVAPVFYRLLVSLSAAVAGVSELSLRFPAFVAGCALLVVVAVWAKRLGGWTGSLLALLMLVLHPLSIRYSALVKPYLFDALFAAWVQLEAWRFLVEDDGARPKRLIIAGALGLVLSTTAPLVLAPLSAAWILHWLRHKKGFALLLGSVVGWGLLGGLVQLASLQTPAVKEMMQRFWQKGFIAGPGWGENAILFFHHTLGVLLSDLGFMSARVGPWLGLGWLFVFAVGGVAFWKKGKMIGLMILLGPLVCALATSALRLYPLSPRTSLFILPGLLVLGSAGGAKLIGCPRGRRIVSILPVIGVALLTAVPHGFRMAQALRVPAVPGARELLRDLRPMVGADDVIYVGARAVPSWTLYTTDWNRPPARHLEWLARTIAVSGPAYENAPSRGRGVGSEEGAELLYRWGKVPVLLGLPAGNAFIEHRGLSRRGADAGFFEREIARILKTGASRVWFFASHDLDGTTGALPSRLPREAGFAWVEVFQKRGYDANLSCLSRHRLRPEGP